jgi:(1->4)-alpha-D-glucan 1-alpha-D-glucosylmutase
MSVVQELLGKTAERLASRRRFPESTYRLQFHAGFTFRDAAGVSAYLHDLGVSHCYASPYLQARPGSQHGYDITDHRALNREIGTDEEYESWVSGLHELGMGQVLDIVPNHMGIVGNGNAWWNDVLENGPSSPYASFFDIAWQDSPRLMLCNRVLLPVLGEPYGKVLEAGQIRLAYEGGAFSLHYFDHRFPVEPGSYARLLEPGLPELEAALAPDAPALLEYQSILTAVGHLPQRTETDPARVAERQREKEVIKRRLAALTQECGEVRSIIEKTVARFNGQSGDPHSFDLLDALLDEQVYRLSFWRVAADEINYRRFFDINELAALSMEKPEVFTATHELILRLLSRGKVDGVRIDHPDGLYDPRQYLRRLQEAYVLACARVTFDADPAYRGQDWDSIQAELEGAVRAAQDADSPLRRPLYALVEKILGANEQLPPDWDTYGTSGYDFVNAINGLFVETENEKAFTQIYREWTNLDESFSEVVYQKKLLTLQVSLSSELQMLAHQLDRLAQKNRMSRDFTLYSLRGALRQVIACFPVYRSYISEEGVHDTDRKYVETAVRRAMTRNPTVSKALFRFIRDMLLLRSPENAGEEDRAEQRRFAGKFQQVTAPVMAKGLEDTAFYVYVRLLSLNEVGGDAGRFGLSPEAVHRFNRERQATWPWALSPLSTHDTKRSEDVRARLNVLSELPGEWHDRLAHWSQLNEAHRSLLDDVRAPDANEDYLLYQTLLGAWPLEPYSAEEYDAFVERIQNYMVKALHEAKVHTSWINPDEEYDAAVRQFVGRILDEQTSGPFLADLRAFARRLSHYGLLNSLSQTLLRIASPGVPDTYQGTELWDFSLVDPDNRRPVDYALRRELLSGLQADLEKAGPDRRQLARALAEDKEDGRIKLYVTAQGLHARRNNPGLFSSGEYLPAQAVGAQRDYLFGFMRRQEGRRAVVVVPRLLTRLLPERQGLPLGDVWQDTRVLLPEMEPGQPLRNVFTGEELTCENHQGQASLAAGALLAHFPVALLLS